ncbi:hypothetical protein HZB88_02445 [archaeon]|nr:hypothetical protein [archaeon]
MKQLTQCMLCGINLAAYACTVCGRNICKGCFDRNLGLCVACRSGKSINSKKISDCGQFK